MHDNMSLGHKSWVCPQWKELQALREQACSLVALIVDMEKQMQAEKKNCETSGNLQASFHPQMGSSSAARDQS